MCIVPVAEAYERFADCVNAGIVPGYTDWTELFDPNDTVVATIHPTEETYYLVACVHYATIFGQSPVGLTNITTAAAGWPFDPPTPEQAASMQQIAWDVVQNDSYACLPNLSTENIGSEKKHQVFPNPSGGNVRFSLDKQVKRVLIYNAIGQLVQTIYPEQTEVKT